MIAGVVLAIAAVVIAVLATREDPPPTSGGPSPPPPSTTPVATTNGPATTSSTTRSTPATSVAESLGDFERSLIRIQAVVDIVVDDADFANRAWDAGMVSLDVTDAALEAVLGKTDEILGVTRRLGDSGLVGSEYGEILRGVETLNGAAGDMLAGLRVRASDEAVPGTIRRNAHTALLAASGGIQVSVTTALARVAPNRYLQELIAIDAALTMLSSEAEEINGSWDDIEGILRSQNRMDERRTLFDITEAALMRIAVHSEDLAMRAGRLSPPVRDASLDSIQRNARRMSAEARNMVEGLRLRLDEERIPGAARRKALERFLDAAQDLEEAVVREIDALG